MKKNFKPARRHPVGTGASHNLPPGPKRAWAPPLAERDCVADQSQMSQQFFATVQNKMHWAAHGQTAAEVIHARVDATKPFMGLKTTRPGGIIRKEDVSVAKNYLPEETAGSLACGSRRGWPQAR